IMPDYNPRMKDTKASGEDAVVQEKNKIALNQALLGNISQEESRLDQLKTKHPELGADIDKRKGKLNDIRTQKQLEINNSRDLVDKAVNGGVLTINTNPTVDEIMPDYTPRMNNIASSTKDAVEKEKDKISLNQSLI